MTINTKLYEKLEGANNLRAWKYGVMLTLEENQIWKSSLKRTSQNLKKMRTKQKGHLGSVIAHPIHEAYELDPKTVHSVF